MGPSLIFCDQLGRTVLPHPNRTINNAMPRNTKRIGRPPKDTMGG